MSRLLWPIVLLIACLWPANSGAQDPAEKPAEKPTQKPAETLEIPISTTADMDHSTNPAEVNRPDVRLFDPANLWNPGQIKTIGGAYPPLPPNAVMGQFPKEIKDPPANPIPPDWLAPYLAFRLRNKGALRAYGFVRGDWVTATKRFDDIQIPQWVLSQDSRFVPPNASRPITDNGTNYSMYPRLTRIGFDYFHPEIESLPGAHAWARIETDFLTRQTKIDPLNPPSRELLRLRLAYAAIEYNNLSLVIGQDWDILSPLLPVFNAGTQNAYVGNLGDRRPIAYVNYDWKRDDGVKIQIQNGVALADAIDQADPDGDGFRDQENYGLPGYEWRVGAVIPTSVEDQPLMFGISGEVATSQHDGPVSKKKYTTSWAVNADLRFPINQWINFQGEIWGGQALADWRGGISQSINPDTGMPVRALGGWFEVYAMPYKHFRSSLGMGVDKPYSQDLPTPVLGKDGFWTNTSRTRNLAYWLSNQIIFDHGVILGLDTSIWSTQWKDIASGNATMIDLYLQANF